MASKVKTESSDVLKKMTELKKGDGLTSTEQDMNASSKSNTLCDEAEIRKRFV